MSLSPDECKWSERLTPTQQGMRCGFTGTWACEWDVLELRLLYGRLWRRYERVMYACVCVWVSLASFTDPTSPQTLTSSGLLSIPQEDTLTPSTTPESGWACLWMCICVSCFPKWTDHIFVFSLDSVLRLNFSWLKTCAVSESQVVPLMSQAHLHPFDSAACHLIATTAVHAEEPARFYDLARTATCFHKLASWTPTHVGLHSLLFKWNISLANERVS